MDGAAGAGGLKAAMGGMVNDVGSQDDAGLGMARGQGGAQGGRRAFFPLYSCDASVTGAGSSANVLLIHAEFIETERGFMV